MEKIIACSPNISEGEDIKKIKKILLPIEKNKNLKLLLVHSFKNFNRTQAFFIGSPKNVQEGAIDLVTQAVSILDMKTHIGDHPRIGVVDVLPFIPIFQSTIEECIEIAHDTGKIIANKNNLPVFFYGKAAKREEFKELSNLRDDEYEGLKELFKAGEIEPDEGGIEFNEKAGAIAIGARFPIVSIKININTNNTEIADKVAKKIRENGFYTKDGTHEAGKLSEVNAVGLKEPKNSNAFIMMAITNTAITPIHVAYLEVRKTLENLNYDIESTEIRGFVFKNMLIEAGESFCKMSNKSLTKEKDLVNFALEYMKVKDFNAKKKIIDA